MLALEFCLAFFHNSTIKIIEDSAFITFQIKNLMIWNYVLVINLNIIIDFVPYRGHARTWFIHLGVNSPCWPKNGGQQRANCPKSKPIVHHLFIVITSSFHRLFVIRLRARFRSPWADTCRACSPFGNFLFPRPYSLLPFPYCQITPSAPGCRPSACSRCSRRFAG